MSQHSRRGFSLIECMVYCVALGILMVCCFNGVLVVYMNLAAAGNRAMCSTGLYGAHDQLVHDIRLAPAERAAWKKIEKQELVWRGKKEDMGWSVKDDRLLRLTGQYHAENNKWHKKVTSVVLTSVKSVAFAVQADADWVQAIRVILQKKSDSVASMVVLRNGRVGYGA